MLERVEDEVLLPDVERLARDERRRLVETGRCEKGASCIRWPASPPPKPPLPRARRLGVRRCDLGGRRARALRRGAHRHRRRSREEADRGADPEEPRARLDVFAAVFTSDRWSNPNNGVIADYAPSTKGGGAILIVGYEQIEGRPYFIFRNSWDDNVLLGFSVGIKRKVACAERARACGRSTPARTDAPPTVSRTRRPVPRRPARSPRERTS